jgi:hypothetical protein
MPGTSPGMTAEAGHAGATYPRFLSRIKSANRWNR